MSENDLVMKGFSLDTIQKGIAISWPKQDYSEVSISFVKTKRSENKFFSHKGELFSFQKAVTCVGVETE